MDTGDLSAVVSISSVADTAGVTSMTASLDEMSASAEGAEASAVAGAEASTAALEDTAAASTAAAAGAKDAAVAADTSSASLTKMGGAAKDVGATMSEYISLPIAGIMAVSAKMAMTFQQDMELLATQAGVPQAQIKSLSNSILDMASSVGQGPDQLAQAFYHIASAMGGMMNETQELNVLKVAAEGADIGQANLADTTYALSSAMASGVTGTKNAADMMATLNAIVGAGDMHMQDLNGAISTGFLSTAAAFGISIQSVGAALATLTDNGESAEESATRLRMMWSLMASPSKQASDQLQALGLTESQAAGSTDAMNKVFSETGLTTTKLANDLRQPNGVTVAIQDLQTHLEKAGLNASQTDAILSKAFGGGKSDAALLTLLQNTDRLGVKFQSINANSTKFSQDWQEQQETNKQKWDDAWSGIEADMIKLGDDVLPSVISLMSDLSAGVKDVTGWYEGLSTGQKQFALDAAAVIAAAGPVLVVFGTLAKSVSSIVDLGSGIWDVLGNVPGGVKSTLGMFSNMGSGIGDASSAFGSWISNASSAAGDISGSAAKAAAAWTTSAASWVKDSAKATGSLITDAAKATGAWIVDAHNSEIGLGGTLIKMGVDAAQAAATFVKEAAIASAAWVKNAAVASFAWVTQELPKIAVGFVTTSGAATKNAIIASAVWTKEAIVSSAAWAKETAIMIADQLAVSAAAIKDGAIAAGVWIATAAKTGVYTTALDLSKTTTYLLGDATVATGLTMAGVFAGLAIDAALVYKAVNSIVGAYDAVQQANEAAKSDAASEANAHSQLEALAKNGTASQQARAKYEISQGFANGTDYAPGGVALVGEEGPELVYLPQGSQVVPTPQTDKILNSSAAHITADSNSSNGPSIHQEITIQNVILPTSAAASGFFKQMGQDTINIGKGLTTNQGVSGS